MDERIDRNVITENLLKLMEATYSQAGLKHLVNVGFEILGNPFFICDISYKILGYSDCEIDDEILHWEHIKNDQVAYETVLKIKSQGVLEETYKGAEPVRRQLDHESIASMAVRIAIDNKPVGHIVLYEYLKPFSETDKVLLMKFAEAVSNELLKNEAHLRAGKLDEITLAEMLRLDVKQDATRIKILAHDFATKKYLYALCASQDKRNPAKASLNYLKDIITEIIPDSISVVYKKDIVVLIGNDSPYTPFSEPLRKQVDDFLAINSMYAGLSRSFTDMGNLKKHYQFARTASWFGEIYDQSYRAYLYDEYYLFDLFASLELNRELQDFCSDAVLEMMQYDKEANTDYLESARCYLENDKNLNKCAQKMCMHRNSMDYRIKKIEELFHVDFSDENFCFSFYLSVKILAYKKILQ